MTLQVGVKAIIQNKSGKYLLLKRSQAMDSEDEPSWDIPGGRIESHEPLADALAREILEETGLKLNSQLELLAAQDIFVPAKDLHVVRLTYRVSTEDTKVELSEEHTEYTWVDSAEAKTMNLEPYLKEVITTRL